MNKKSLLIMAVCILMCTIFFSFTANAATVVDSGKCGDNLTWTLDDTGKLTISGNGEMYGWSPMYPVHGSSAPWSSYGDKINTVEIGYGVTNIGENAFVGCSSLTNVSLSNSLTGIDNSAFFSCSTLERINLPDSLTYIGMGVFLHCTSLKKLQIPDCLEFFYDDVAKGCSSLEGFDVGRNNKFFSNDKFGVLFNKDKTELIRFPLGLHLDSYKIPDSVKTICDSAFYGCDSLISIEIPDSVTYIGEGAFTICKSLTNIKLPNGIKSLGNYAFGWCTSLKNVIIPDSVLTLRNNLFVDCTALETIIIPPSVIRIDGYDQSPEDDSEVFRNCNKLIICGYTGSYAEKHAVKLNIPFYSLGKYEDTTEIKIIDCNTFPNNITWIFDNTGTLTVCGTGTITPWHNRGPYDNTWAAYNDSIKTLVVETGITGLRDTAFFVCHKLEKVFIPPSVIKIDSPYEPYSYTAGGLVDALPNKDLTIYGYSGTYAEDYVNFCQNEPFHYHHNTYTFQSLGTYTFPAERTIVDSGTCGDNITWTIDDMRTLTISGTGVIDLGEEMPEDYGPWWFSAPWDAYNTAIKKIVINEGITGIDDDALNGGVMVESVVLPMSLTDFSARDFNGADNMTFYGYKGSYSESVAVQNDIPFVALNGNSDIHSVKVGREIVLTIGKKSINKNGIISKLDVPAQLINSRTMVPLRAIFEALGAYVHWEDSTQTITAIKDDTVVILVIGKNSINVNGVDKPLDVPAMLVDSRTLVPARAVAESFGCDVLWDDATQTVTIR